MTNMDADVLSLSDLTTSRNWSPDGKIIAFIEKIDSIWGISRINADGSGYARLSKDRSIVDLTWSPDGEKIAFVSLDPPGCGENCNVEINWMNPDGSQQKNLTDNPAQDYNPVWSPDGSQLAFVSDREGNNEVYVLNLANGKITNLTDDPAYDSEPTWSPDGKWIAFVSGRDGNADIYVVDLSGENLFRLTTDPGDDWFPVWGLAEE